jgi:large subunit ribosomal protein L25
MAQIVQLAAEPRAPQKKTGARALRSAGKVPAILYGHGAEPQPLAVGAVELGRLLENIHPESTIVEVSLGAKTVRALIREIQRHPLRPGIVHIDLQEIHAGEKIRIEVPVHLVGIPDGVRNQGGTLDQVLRTIEIEVDPTQIPERVELDVTALVIGRSLHVSDLSIPGVRIMADPSLSVCTVAAPRVEEVVAPVAAEGVVVAPEGEAVAEPEVIKKGKVEESEEEAAEE